ncbi:SpaA isopeptide-forming pilin-related protein [Youngiibacter multivorans]|uniref:LPXTG-motif cell wall-anchored protein n=1 Tax=Youngiibacter multivorans TaxID=937251 RepID=A0ABS4G526_9CLOT|nr:SpaA isopeptide-forming pilin-related protein [Youngiibacter multivorans]MBP1919651.1 LPXTG-motif cell wall-anchored protein [Youngiibacter multivorans]
MKGRIRKFTALVLSFAMAFTFIGSSQVKTSFADAKGVLNIQFDAVLDAMQTSGYGSLTLTLTHTSGATFTASSTNKTWQNAPYGTYTVSLSNTTGIKYEVEASFDQQGKTYNLVANKFTTADTAATIFFKEIKIIPIALGTLVKYGDDGKPLAGATFKVTDSNNVVSYKTSGPDGIVFSDMLIYKDTKITVQESEAPHGYVLDNGIVELNYPIVGINPSIEDLNVLKTITNTRAKISVTGNKVWRGGPKPDIQVQLYRDNELMVGYEPVTLTSTNTEYTWKDLYLTDSRGNDYKYSIKEVSVPENYDVTYSNDGLTVTNTFIVPKISVTGYKKWIGGPKPDVAIQLYQDGEAYGDKVTFSAMKTSHTWTDLPETDLNGKFYTYTIDEPNVPVNYSSTLSADKLTVTNEYKSPVQEIKVLKEWENGPLTKPTIQVQLYQNGVEYGAPVDFSNGKTSHTWTVDVTDSDGKEYEYTAKEVEVPDNYEVTYSDDELTITNKYIVPVISVTGTKIWEGGTKPDVEIQLYQDGEEIGDPVIFSSTKTSHTWYNLPGTDESGNAYEYTIDELDVPENYTKTLSEDKLTITNSYTSPKQDITVRKVWENGPEIKPTIEVQLYQDGVEYGAPVEFADGKTSNTWTVDVTDTEGKNYVYTAKEVTVPENYEATYSDDKLTITNMYIVPKIEISGSKLWEGNLQKPEKITVILYQDGEKFTEQDVYPDSNGDWSFSFKNIPGADLDGNEFEYTVGEATPAGFITSVNGYTITNTSIKGNIQLKKVDESDRPLEGALFGLFKSSDELLVNVLSTSRSNSDGLVNFTGVEYGSYLIKELEAPEGYNTVERIIEISITENNKSVIPVDGIVKNTRIRGNIAITKYGESNVLLSGARFELRQGEKLIATVTTDNYGKAEFENVLYGDYQIYETAAPIGYVASQESIQASVTTEGETVEIQVHNRRIAGTIVVHKLDEKQNPIAGAIFVLKQDGAVKFRNVASSSSDAIEFRNIPEGVYELEEEKAPTGFIRSAAVEKVVIDEDGEVISLDVVNKVIKGNILISKIGDDGELLEGAEFVLFLGSEQFGKPVTTDENGEALIEGVPYGTYTLKETKAPEGYVLTDVAKAVEIEVDGETIELEIKNSLITSTVSIKKIEAGSTKVLSGAEFTIEDEEGGVVFTGTTGTSGTLNVILPFGKYIVRESKAPEGYNKTDMTYSVTVNADGETFDIVAENEKIEELEEVDPADDEEEGSLPQTGGIPSELLYAVGMIAMAGGVVLMRKKEEK